MGDNLKQRHRELLVKTLDEFIAFCKKNDIQYVAAYGTVLGAVRHQGLIPWDDDIDVYMTRENYNKFLSKKQQLEGTGYEIVDPSNKGYYLDFAKFCDTNTTIWEFKEYPFIVGVFVDVFPLDQMTPENKKHKLIQEHYYKTWSRYYLSLSNQVSFSQSMKCLFHGKFSMFRIYIYSKFKRILYLLWTKWNKKMSNIKGEFYISHCQDKNLFIEKDVIENPQTMYFESLSINVPSGWDKYLKTVYGNYMEYPPIEQRNSGHVSYFMNLNHRYTIDELRLIFNK